MIDPRQIDPKDFPLNYDRYNHVMDELLAAAKGFVHLDRQGWPGGVELDRRIMNIRAELNDVWSQIQRTEEHLIEVAEAADVTAAAPRP